MAFRPALGVFITALSLSEGHPPTPEQGLETLLPQYIPECATINRQTQDVVRQSA